MQSGISEKSVVTYPKYEKDMGDNRTVVLNCPFSPFSQFSQKLQWTACLVLPDIDFNVCSE